MPGKIGKENKTKIRLNTVKPFNLQIPYKGPRLLEVRFSLEITLFGSKGSIMSKLDTKLGRGRQEGLRRDEAAKSPRLSPFSFNRHFFANVYTRRT